MTSYEIYLQVIGTVNKEENGYLPAALFNTWEDQEETNVFNDYQARLQNPQTAAVEKSKLKDLLTPFHTRRDITIGGDGFFLLPDDYAYFSAARARFDQGVSLVLLNHYNSILCEEDPVTDVVDIQAKIDKILKNPDFVDMDLLDAEQVSERLKSAIAGKRPSQKRPVMERVDKGMQVFPQSSGSGSLFLFYYRRPVPAKLFMTVDPDTHDEIPDTVNSTACEWGREAIADVVDRIVKRFSIYVREKDLFQMASK